MNWKVYLKPKSWFLANKIIADKKRLPIFIGRRFGKTGMLYHTMVDSLPVSDEKKKELHEQYEKALRGE